MSGKWRDRKKKKKEAKKGESNMTWRITSLTTLGVGSNWLLVLKRPHENGANCCLLWQFVKGKEERGWSTGSCLPGLGKGLPSSAQYPPLSWIIPVQAGPSMSRVSLATRKLRVRRWEAYNMGARCSPVGCATMKLVTASTGGDQRPRAGRRGSQEDLIH